MFCFVIINDNSKGYTMKDKALKIVLSSLVLYALLGFIVLPLIIKSQVEKNLNDLLIPTASLENVEFNPFTMQVKLHGFIIKDTKKELIKFKELSVKLSVLKSIHKKHISFKEVKLSDFFINVIQEKDGSINLLSLLKEQPKDEKVTKETSENNSVIPFKISKTILDNANIKLSLNNGDNPLNLALNSLNYTFYELGTYKNSLASHSLNTIINKHTQLKVKGGFNLIPFKMYGNVHLNNLQSNDYLPYSSNLLNFDTSNAIINLDFGFQVDLSKGIKVRLNNTNFELKELVLSQNEKKFTGLKSLEIKNLNLHYPEQKIDIDSININALFAHAIIDKEGNLNFANLIKKQDGHRIQAVKEKRKTKEKVWDVNLKDLNVNSANITFNDIKNKTALNTKDININLNNVALLGTQLNLNKATLKVSNVKLNDKKNKTVISTKNINIDLNDIALLDTQISLKKTTLKVSSIKMHDKKSKTKINSNKFILTLNNINKNQDKIKIKKLNILQPYTKTDSTGANVVAKNLNLNIYDILNKGNYLKVKKALLNKPKISITVKKKAVVKTTKNETKEKQKEIQKKQQKQETKKVVKKEPSFTLDLGPFKIANANVIFEDKNLPIPFKTNISKLNGDFSEFITKSSKPTKLNLEGQVDKYGYTKITGLVDHKNIKNLTDVQLLFKNIAINNFTPYSGKFVG